jgi:hypothetical protein
MINQKGGLTQSAEEIKTKAKQNIAAPADYNKMFFQLKAFLALIEIPFGDKSITAGKLQALICLIELQSIYYKGALHLTISFHQRYFGQSALSYNSSLTVAPSWKIERKQTTPSLTGGKTTGIFYSIHLVQPSHPASKMGRMATLTPGQEREENREAQEGEGKGGEEEGTKGEGHQRWNQKQEPVH